MIIRYTIAIILFLNCADLFSQSLQRYSAFSCSGDYSNIGTLQLQSNIGELMADTYIGSQNIFTQGFVQPEAPITTKIKEIVNTGEANIFPNPVSDKLNVQLGLIEVSDIKIEVYDLLGKVQILSISDDNKNYELNFEPLNSGIYFMKISSVKSKFNKIFKINKI